MLGESDDEIIQRLASLSILEYDRVRKDEANKLRVRVENLDRAVKAIQRDNVDDSSLPDVEPWELPIDPAGLLTDISATVSRFIVCDKEIADSVALWVAMTWFIDVVQIAPLAIITAPEKRCGKTQLLTILGKLSYTWRV